MNIIEVEELSKKFGQLVAVDKVSFQVPEGEIFGFLGPNGAGKTTTINMLCTLIKPTGGRATLCGHDVLTQRSEVRPLPISTRNTIEPLGRTSRGSVIMQILVALAANLLPAAHVPSRTLP